MADDWLDSQHIAAMHAINVRSPFSVKAVVCILQRVDVGSHTALAHLTRLTLHTHQVSEEGYNVTLARVLQSRLTFDNAAAEKALQLFDLVS